MTAIPGGRKVITFANILQHDVFLRHASRNWFEIRRAGDAPSCRDRVCRHHEPREGQNGDLPAANPPDSRHQGCWIKTLRHSDDQMPAVLTTHWGHGIMNEIYDIIYVKTDDYSASHNQEIAWEIEKRISKVPNEGRNHVLYNPGLG